MVFHGVLDDGKCTYFAPVFNYRDALTLSRYRPDYVARFELGTIDALMRDLRGERYLAGGPWRPELDLRGSTWWLFSSLLELEKNSDRYGT